MRKSIQSLKALFLTIALTTMQFALFAQEKVTENTVSKAEVSGWFQRNWMWVTGGIVLLLLIIIFSGSSSSRRKTTTVVRDEFGNSKSVSTTETVD